MTGRLADLFRLAWGLLYWNARKSWFQLRRGRSPCPCQSPSDSGRALETGCEACLSWHHQANFRRVCPLLVQTPDGLRCSVDAAQVRPFWRRMFGFYGGTLGAVYLAGALAIFVFLRVIGYPISIVHLVWPGSWHRVGEVRGWFFFERANRAFATGQPAAGLLYLSNAYDFDRNNYTVGLLLAQKLELGQSRRSDEIYRRLLASPTPEHARIAQAWFRALLARGDFDGVQHLAQAEVLGDAAHAGVWLRALLFATRQTRADAPVHELLASNLPAAQRWRPVLETERLLRSGRRAAALAALTPPWSDAPAYALFYQINELTALGEGLAAADLVGHYGPRLDDTARATLLLEAYATLGARQSRQGLINVLLAPPLKPPTISLLAAHLIRHPDTGLFGQLLNRFTQEKLSPENAGLDTYLALFCTAGAVGDWERLHQIAAVLRRDARSNLNTLSLAEAFFRGQTPHTRIAGLISALPTTLEVHYALLERYPGQRTGDAFLHP